MAAIYKNVFTAFLIVCLSMQVLAANNTGCFQRKCRECSGKEAALPGDQAMCELRNMVTPSWLDDGVDKLLPGPLQVNVDWTCLKMVASDPSVVGDSVDVIKGCVLTANAKGICDALIGVELVKGKKDAVCTYCTGDYCNSAVGTQVSAVALLVSMVLAKLMNH